MSQEQEKYFEKLVPLRSLIGREFLALQSERNKQRQIFESSPQKMSADTLSYRRSEIALGRFLDDMIRAVEKADFSLLGTKEKLEIAEAKAQGDVHGIVLKRKEIKTIWRNFAVERYQLFAEPLKQTFKKYHPSLWRELDEAFKKFELELDRWVFGHQPFDGSQAMSNMIEFQVKCRLIASHND